MHTHDPPYAHNDLKPGNVLLLLPKNEPPVAVIMDFGSAGPARRELQNRKEAMAVQVLHHRWNKYSHFFGNLELYARTLSKTRWYHLTVVSFCLLFVMQEWAAQHCTAPYRAPELWDPPSESSLDERTDIWALGCTLYALM